MAIIIAIASIFLNAYKYSVDNKYDVQIIEKQAAVEIKVSNEVPTENMITKEKYEQLGKKWLTKAGGDGTSSGIYRAFKAINDSLGIISLLPYEEYKEKQEFCVIITLRKKL